MSVLVSCPYGRVRGLADPGGAAFLGMPYAEPPLGPLRFCPPVPRRRVGHLVDATRPGPAPAQLARPPSTYLPLPPPRATAEDCLTLNLWTPACDGARRPVLVHLFGGGFQTGSGSDGFQDGAALSRRADAVVVRLNFRIGALGFLFLGEAFGPPFEAGNVALLDVCAALEWVRDNIAAFGGDPDAVTLFGLSSGAFMLASLFGVGAARGLFHRAWMQSGSASRIIARDVATAQAREVLARLDVAAGDRAGLAAAPLDAILEAQTAICAGDLGERNAPRGRTLGIVADGVTLAEHPLAALARGAGRDVPIVLGTTRDEARLWFETGQMTPTVNDAALEAEMTRFVGAGGPALFAAYRARHPGLPTERLRERFLGDAVYHAPALRTAMIQTEAGGRAWLYRFDWASPLEGGRFGASHGFDEAFVWGAVRDPVVVYAAGDPDAGALADTLCTALVDFGRTGQVPWPAARPPTPVLRTFGGEGDHGSIDPLLLRF